MVGRTVNNEMDSKEKTNERSDSILKTSTVGLYLQAGSYVWMR